MRNRYLIAIITYNPDINTVVQVLENFSDCNVLIVDNKSINSSEIRVATSLYKNLHIIFNDENKGIAEALNQALNFATKNNFEYLLTLDQDSIFTTSIQPLLDGFSYSSDISIICPSIVDVNSKNEEIPKQEYEEVFIAITSGCMCSVEKLNNVGGFNSRLFIDYVDYELCLKLQDKGYKILRTNKAVLSHTLGESRIYKFLGMKFIATNHSPLRRYYNARNRVYIYNKYIFKYPGFVINNFMSFLKTILIIVLFEDRKLAKLSQIFKGIIAGVLF